MNSPFDILAPSYESTWSSTPEGRMQREEVWKVIDTVFLSGSRILDLGCGTGDDALRLQRRGVDVYGIDSSQNMVDIARSRQVDAHWLWMEDLASVQGVYSGALSNFGALNCVQHLEPVANHLARLVRPQGALALCVMGLFCWRETVQFLRQGKLRKATRRWWGHASWRGIPIRYWSGKEMRRAFHAYFEFLSRVSIGRGDHQLYIFRRRPL
jgi:ubiquinone/menaquinone biosynthesis C-methylase UbiE